MLSIGGNLQCSDFMRLRFEVLIFLFIFLLAIFFSNYRIVKEKTLILENARQKTITAIGVPDRRFSLNFIHSVQKTPVHEFFFISVNNKLVLDKTTYHSLGVGLPFSEENGKFLNKNGEFVLSMNREFESIPIRISPIPKHSITVGGKEYPLLNFADPEGLLTIRAKDRLTIKNISRKEQENE